MNLLSDLVKLYPAQRLKKHAKKAILTKQYKIRLFLTLTLLLKSIYLLSRTIRA